METINNFKENQPKLSIGFFFLCLGTLITLITSVVSFLNLVFGTLDKQFPDVLNASYQYGYNTYDFEGIRIALATLIIFFPVFVIVSFFWKRHIKKGIGHIDEIIKKWLVYLVLFLSSVVTAVDLVILVKYFVSGEITSRFVYKVITVFIVAILVGSYYYILEISHCGDKLKKNLGIIYSIVGILLVLTAVIYSFSVIGSPQKQRLLRFDDRRVSDLQNIQYQIITYWQQKEKLPEDIKDLASPLTGYSLPVPPMFDKGEKYEYLVKYKNALTFELCAEFSLPMPKGWREGSYYGGEMMPMMDKGVTSTIYPSPIGGANESWDHQAGRTCFERTIDKDIYPPFSKSANY
jgi:hypothetical protein